MVKVVCLSFLSIVKCDIKGTAYGDDYLFAFLVRMAAPAFPSWNVICPINSFHAERYLPQLFCYSKVSSWVNDFGKVYESA